MKTSIVRAGLQFALAGFIAAFAVPAVRAQVELTGTTMGPIRYSVKIESLPDGLTREAAHAIVERELKLVDGLMSTYRNDSDVSRFNQSASTDWIDVQPETYAVVARALEISELSGGAFDITVAPLVNLWDFGPNPADRTQKPNDQEIADARARIGYQKIHVRAEPPAIRKDDPQVWIDLSAIAEGFASDRVAAALVEAGAQDILVDIGGEIVARGKKSDGQNWRIGIVWPSDNELISKEVAELKESGLATSGDYRNFVIIDGVRYSHTIDPKTGYPIQDTLASATVIAPDCMTADAMATAVMVMGAHKGHLLCAQLQLPLLTYERRGEEFVLRKSPDFPTPANAVAAVNQNAWPVFVAALVIFGLVVAGMAIGVIWGNRRIAGSCGGLANMRDEQGNIACAMCTRPSEECRDPKKWQVDEELETENDTESSHDRY